MSYSSFSVKCETRRFQCHVWNDGHSKALDMQLQYVYIYMTLHYEAAKVWISFIRLHFPAVIELTMKTKQLTTIPVLDITYSNWEVVLGTLLIWSSFFGHCLLLMPSAKQGRNVYCAKSISQKVKWELKREPAFKSSLPCIRSLNWLYCFALQWLTAHLRSNVLHVHAQGDADRGRWGWSEVPLQDTSMSATSRLGHKLRDDCIFTPHCHDWGGVSVCGQLYR